jgi:chaperonin cofactor prefoldin
MNMDRERRAEQLYHQLGLDPVVNKLLKDFPSSLSGMDRIVDKMFGPYDIKSRAKAVAKLTALIAYTALSEEYDKEVAKLEAQAKSLEGERDRVRSNYDNLVQKVAHIFEEDHEGLESEKTTITSALERLKTNYEELRTAITTLVGTIPYDEIREKSGQELYSILLEDSGLQDILKDSAKKLIDFKRYLGMAAEKGAEEASRHAVETLSGIMRNKIDKVRIEVTLYTQTGVLSGSVYHLEWERLSDLLNDVSDRRGWRASPFLEFSNVNAHNPEGYNEMLPTAHVKKATIYIITLTDANAARGVGARDGLKSFPFVPKSRVPVELQMADYSLIGNMHCAPGQKPQNVLDETPKFLPLTDASIRLMKENIRLTAPFVAVNKEQILALAQEEISPGFSGLIGEHYMKLLKLKLGYLN